TEQCLLHRSLQFQGPNTNGNYAGELCQPWGSNTKNLACKQLKWRRCIDQNLHDAAPLLFGHTICYSYTIELDTDENQDHTGIGNKETGNLIAYTTCVI